MNPTPSQGDLLQTPAPDPVQTELLQLRLQVGRLRGWLFALAAAALPLFLAVVLFMAYQARTARAQLLEMRPQLERAMNEFKRGRETNIVHFLAQLHVFAATNRDFQPVLERYRPHLGQYYPLTPGAIAPAGGGPAPLNLPPPRPDMK
jgi:hypothetical protein